MARATPAATPYDALVEDTFYLTVGIEVEQRLLPVEKGVSIRPGPLLAPGIGVDASGRVYGRPERAGTFSAPVQVCRGRTCSAQQVTFVVLRNVPWAPAVLTFPGRVGERLYGSITIRGGPAGVPPAFTVTDHDALPEGVTIGPDGQVGGVPTTPGVSRVPVRICLAGNCAGVVVTLIVI
ncbi:hypothetical protein ACQEUU_29005 [Nonomuraea sp. CA-218870]|uniref:hypothetical protein n=1 Tax=Nonomuraea sp. CA-218870 TaxID=3239998 RepID=UPI003D91664B